MRLYPSRFNVIALLFGIMLMSLSACEQGSYWDADTKQMESDKVGRLEAVGEDLRIYEFTPQTSPNVQCVFVAGENKGGLQCWPKAEVADAA